MSSTVNRPVIKEQKEADVNRKLQIYGIISAFQNGKVPSNDQIDIALNSFLESNALSNPDESLSSDGKLLINDAKEVVKQAKHLLLSKNDGNLLQDFIWQTTQFDPKSISSPNAPVTKDAAKRDGDEALQGLRTLGTLLVTNGQFRKLLKDSATLLRDIAGDAATGAANKVRPSEEALAQMDQAAEDNTWHEKPDFSKDNLKKQAQGVYGGKPKQDAKDVANAGLNATSNNASAGNNVSSAQNATKNALQAKVDQHVDQETKDNVKKRNEEYRRKANDYFNKKMPKERKDQVIFRLKKMILECQQHADYSEAIQTLLRLAENYGRHGRTVGKGSASTAKEARSGFSAAEADLRTLIERFANGTSTQDLWDSIAQIYKDAEQDPELRNWFKSLDAYIRRLLLEQGYILQDDSTRQWDRLFEQGKYLLREKYRSHTNRVVDEIKFIADQFDKDRQNKAFAESIAKLFKDLGNGQDGKAVFKPHLVKDLTEIIIPSVLKNVSYIPIPRIEYSDPQFDAIVENLVLESDNFMPNVFEVASDHYFRIGRKKIANKHKNTLEIKVAGIQMDLRDVSFHINRKKGFPSITDTGIVDILLPGDGFSFKMKVSSVEKKDSQNFFKVDKVDVDIHDLKLKVKKSSHKLLINIIKPIALRAMRPVLQSVIEKVLKDQFNQLDALLFEVKKEADKALAEAKSSPENAPNVYKRYSEAFQRLMKEKKEKAAKTAKKVTEDKKVNIAITQEDSIFPNIKLPGGISSKATEYKDLARKGEKWESPVFSIGSANKSTDIPAVPRIERKSRVAAGMTHGNGHGHAVSSGVGNGHGNGYSNGHGNGYHASNNGMALNGGQYGNGKTNGHNFQGQRTLYEQTINQPSTGALPGRF